jgi:MFS family permease
MMADNIEHVISYWVMFQAFHSPALGGFAVISHWLPFLLFSVHAGALADRYDCRRLIQISQGLFMLASVAWGLLFLTGTLRVWHAVVILLIHGGAGVIGGPAIQLIIHDIVGTGELQSAIRLNASSRNLSVLLGPAVGGGLMLLLGPGWGLLTNVLIYLPLTALLFWLPYTGHSRHGAPAAPGLGIREALSLFREARVDRRIVTMIVLAGVTSLFVGSGFQPQMPEYAHDLGAEQADVWYSVLLAANAAPCCSKAWTSCARPRAPPSSAPRPGRRPWRCSRRRRTTRSPCCCSWPPACSTSRSRRWRRRWCRSWRRRACADGSSGCSTPRCSGCASAAA